MLLELPAPEDARVPDEETITTAEEAVSAELLAVTPEEPCVEPLCVDAPEDPVREELCVPLVTPEEETGPEEAVVMVLVAPPPVLDEDEESSVPPVGQPVRTSVAASPVSASECFIARMWIAPRVQSDEQGRG